MGNDMGSSGGPEHAPTDDTESRDAVALDDVFELCADRSRRRALYHLRDADGAVSIDELAARITDDEAAGDATLDAEHPSRVSLEHVHVPKMADFDVVNYDRERGEVESRFDDRVDRLLRAAMAEERGD